MATPTTNEIYALAAVIPVVNICVVALRLYCKQLNYDRSRQRVGRQRLRRFSADDGLVVAALVLNTALCVLLVIGTAQQGYGDTDGTTTDQAGFTDNSSKLIRTKTACHPRPQADTIAKTVQQYNVVYNVVSPVVFGLSKLAVLFFYKRIFRGKVFEVLCWSLIIVCALWTLCSFWVSLLQCGAHVSWIPMSAQFLATHCLSGAKIALSIAGLDVVTDLAILILPHPWVWRLHMPFFKKIALTLTFLFGIFTIIASAVRLAMFSIVFPKHNSIANQLSYLSTVFYWGVLEGGMCIIAACLPTWGPLLSRVFAPRQTPQVSISGGQVVAITGSRQSQHADASWLAIFSKGLERAWYGLPGKNAPDGGESTARTISNANMGVSTTM